MANEFKARNGVITPAANITNTTATSSSSTGALVVAGGIGVGGGVYSAGSVTSYSDERLKADWQPLCENYIDKLAQVRCGTYLRVDSGERQAGVSAQSLQPVLPECVHGSEYLAVTYGNAALVSAVELAKEVVDLRARVQILEDLIASLVNNV